MDYTYEYWIELDDGSVLSRDGEARTPDEFSASFDRGFDLRGFFATRSLAHLAGEGFAGIVRKNDGIEITYRVESIVRPR